MIVLAGSKGDDARGRRRMACLWAADACGPSDFAAAPRVRRGPRKLASLKHARPSSACRCGARHRLDSRPQACHPPTWTAWGCILSGERNGRATTQPGRRCGPGDPLCAAEARSAAGGARSALRDLTRRSCLSEENEVNAASSATRRLCEHRREAAQRPAQWGRPARTACRAARPTDAHHERNQIHLPLLRRRLRTRLRRSALRCM
jgi:hypothetical protein